MKRYPKYKDSEVEWIGEIPEGWVVTKIKYNTYVKGRIGWQGLTTDEYIDEGPYLVTGTDFIQGKINWNSCFHVSEERYNQDTYIQIKESDLLITKDGTIGKIALVKNLKGKATLNSGVFVTRPLNGRYDTEFLYWILNSNIFDEYIEYIKSGTTISHLYQNTFIEFSFPLPPIPEQSKVISYLDHKTHQIDTLIEKKQKQIELLKEQRTAIINQAVTKGLNPDVKMKDSGIEWLGKVPEHWEVVRLKYISSIKYGLGQPPRQIENGLPLIRATNIERGKINEKDLIFVDPEDIPYERDPVLKTNDIIVVRSGAYTADSAIIPEEFNGAITGYDLVVRAQKIDPKLLAFILLSNYVLYNQLYLHRLRAAQPHLNAEELGETLVLSPPTSQEQKEIKSFLESENTKIDNTIRQSTNQIDLLQEYRTTLISEAVTGKIDVRDEVIS